MGVSFIKEAKENFKFKIHRSNQILTFWGEMSIFQVILIFI